MYLLTLRRADDRWQEAVLSMEVFKRISTLVSTHALASPADTASRRLAFRTILPSAPHGRIGSYIERATILCTEELIVQIETYIRDILERVIRFCSEQILEYRYTLLTLVQYEIYKLETILLGGKRQNTGDKRFSLYLSNVCSESFVSLVNCAR